MADKVYADGVFIKTQGTQYGDILKLNVKVEDYVKFLESNQDEQGWIRLDITKRKEVSEKGYSHNMLLNDFAPAGQSSAPPAEEEGDLPF